MDFTEPMTLGSPYSSPKQTSSPPQTGLQSSKMLPSYLIGDTTLPSKSPKNNHLFSSPRSTEHASPHFRSITNKDATKKFTSQTKIHAPPVKSLAENFEEITSSPRLHTNLNSTSLSLNQSKFINKNRTILSSQSSPTQIDPFYTQGEQLKDESQLDDTWVTIFGFPAMSASYVLQKFSHFGTIVRYKNANSDGNYMHVKYESSIQAKKALSRNGKILSGNIMIGVTPCIDLAEIEKTKHSLEVSFDVSTQSISSPHNLKQSIRPLTSAYRAAVDENKVANNVSTPQKSTGMISKALDYVFG